MHDLIIPTIIFNIVKIKLNITVKLQLFEFVLLFIYLTTNYGIFKRIASIIEFIFIFKLIYFYQ